MFVDSSALETRCPSARATDLEAARSYGLVVLETPTHVTVMAAFPHHRDRPFEIDADDRSFRFSLVNDDPTGAAPWGSGERWLVGLPAPIDPSTLTLYLTRGVLVAIARRTET